MIAEGSFAGDHPKRQTSSCACGLSLDVLTGCKKKNCYKNISATTKTNIHCPRPQQQLDNSFPTIEFHSYQFCSFPFVKATLKPRPETETH